MENSVPVIEKPRLGYVKEEKIERAVMALKKYIKRKAAAKDATNEKPKSLLEAGEPESSSLEKCPIFVEVVFKNIPENSKTYIHNIVLPYHWRKNLAPEDYNIAIFVPHKKPETEAQKIQFARDRDLDIENTHSYYKDIFEIRLTPENRERISRIITSKELATEFNKFEKIDKLSKTYELFLADKKLMSNKFNALPRRLGRRFWVRERKLPLMIKLSARNLNERFEKVMSTEPFYVVGRSSTERIQVGMNNQKTMQIVRNIQAFLIRLYNLYGDKVRFIKLRANKGLSLPMFADLDISNVSKPLVPGKRSSSKA
jgi:hypothetical protein